MKLVDIPVLEAGEVTHVGSSPTVPTTWLAALVSLFLFACTTPIYNPPDKVSGKAGDGSTGDVVVGVGAAAALAGMLTTVTLDVTVGVPQECMRPTPYSDLELRLIDIKKPNLVTSHDVPGRAFRIDVTTAKGDYAAQLWNTRQNRLVDKIPLTIDTQKTFLMLTAYCPSK